MAYFDLHFHPFTKQFLCKYEDTFPGMRNVHDLEKEIDMKHIIIDWLEENILQILESQSCIEYLNEGNVRIGLASIIPTELLFTQKDGLFGKILNKQKFMRPMDMRFFNEIRDKNISYYHTLLKELDLFRLLHVHNRVNWLSRKRKDDIKDNVINFALSIEGAHAMMRHKVGKPGVADTIEYGDPTDPFIADLRANPLLKAPESLLHFHKVLWEQGFDLMSINLTHLSHIGEQFLATHAYGMKMINNELAYPDSNGISELGYRFIDAAYNLKSDNGADKKIATPVLIDIKHMSLKSRLDFYEYRKKMGYKHPILASHMAVTGLTINEWKARLEDCYRIREPANAISITIDRRRAGKWGLLNNDFSFNAWSINLMDEDITEILNSGGHIGICLDVRVLGWQGALGKTDKEEFISLPDFKTFFPGQPLRKGGEEVFESKFLPTKEERQPIMLCFNILHILSVGYLTTDKNPWLHIMLGSDFDGLISPPVITRNAKALPVLENSLLRWLPEVEGTYIKHNGGPELLPRKQNGKVDLDKLKKFIRGFMYENGETMMTNWLLGKYA
jgi:microsomal dipeptidase-like Zn-dependent dipeptidase